MKKSLYPRVLILNKQSLYKDNATGITLRSLWQNWPKESVLEVYLDAFEKQIADTKNISSYVVYPGILSRVAHYKISQKINAKAKQQAKINLFSKLKSQLRQGCVLMLDLLPVYLTSNIIQQIEAFKPEVIYTLGASACTLNLAHRLSEKYHIPLVIHYMDNWVESLQWENHFLIKPYKFFLYRQLKKCLNHSSLGLTISPQMAQTYRQRFRMSFYSIMNCVEVEKLHLPEKTQTEPLRFVYAGGLHLNRADALLEISQALQSVLPQARLHIYTSSAMVEKSFPANTYFHPPVRHAEIQDVYRQADVLVHAETSDPLLLGFFKYSISTKIPEYLASGRPFLFYGPKELGLYDYLISHQAAYVASDKNSLYKCLRQIDSQGRLEEILKNALSLARKCHDTAGNQRLLYTSLQQAVENHQVAKEKNR